MHTLAHCSGWRQCQGKSETENAFECTHSIEVRVVWCLAVVVGHWATNCLPTALTSMTADKAPGRHMPNLQCLTWKGARKVKWWGAIENGLLSFLADETLHNRWRKGKDCSRGYWKEQSGALCNLEMIFYESLFRYILPNLCAQTWMFVRKHSHMAMHSFIHLL